MKVLLTNDDGYRADGIWALARALAPKAEVVILAPDQQRSAVSHAVTLHKPLRLWRDEKMEEPGITVYYSNGTPADCAMLGIFETAPDCNLVISGVNSGPNMGEDVIYSGTVAAAMEGALLGKTAVAVSLAKYGDNYALAAEFMSGVFEEIAAKGLPPRTLLNINVPPVDKSQYAGFRVTRLGSRRYEDVVQRRRDPRGQVYYWLAGNQIPETADDPGTDHGAVRKGLISISPVSLNWSNGALADSYTLAEPAL